MAVRKITTIKLSQSERETLDAGAKKMGLSLAAYVRHLSATEMRRLQAINSKLIRIEDKLDWVIANSEIGE